VISAVHIDGDSKEYYVKRFGIETNTTGKRFKFINETKGSSLVVAALDRSPEIELTVIKGKAKEKDVSRVKLDELIDVKGWKANGNRLSNYKIRKVTLVENTVKVKTTVANPEKKEPAIEAAGTNPELQEKIFAEAKTEKKVRRSKPKAKTKTKEKKEKKKPEKGGYDIGTTIELDF
jgi:topoisomerase IV subunit A